MQSIQIAAVNDPAEGILDIRETKSYEIRVNGRHATTVVTGSPWRVANAWRGDGEVTVIWNLLREYLNADGEVIRSETRSKEVTR